MDHESAEVPNAGSVWHRWEPHVHAPGTLLNDQFKDQQSWDIYLNALEVALPVIRAIGVTDYYGTKTYERVCAAKKEGRLPAVELIFPNVEMRLALGTVKGKWVNIHLLVSPERLDHLAELRRFLARLTFKVSTDSFCCSEDDLVRLGQRFDPNATDPAGALRRGCEQFKVTFEQLRQAYSESGWAQQNILVAVAGSETDGTSGLREGAHAMLRREVEGFAHIIFASSAAQREFWLGQRAVSEAELWQHYNGPKPCMHGSDAHAPETVGVPDHNRYSWIKGAIEFDALRQAYIDPAGRAFVGESPPINAIPSQIIKTIQIGGAPWAKTPNLLLNSGLVAVIGARGSGKTALADMIALGCNATAERLSKASFLVRANEHLHDSTVSLSWETGENTLRRLDRSDSGAETRYPRARYLSQKFVEELCSADGMTDELLREVERVIFESHPLSERDGAASFEELLKDRASRHRETRYRAEEACAQLSERIGVELDKDKLLDGLKKQISEKEKLIEAYTADRAKLVSKGGELRMKRLSALTEAAEKVRGYLRYFSTAEQSLLTL